MLNKENSPNEEKLLFETRSVEVQEIIGRVPSWILRWGISVIGVVLGVLIIMSFFLKYPDKIASNVSITSSNPPVKILSQTSGRIKQLFVNQNDSISQGSILLIIENSSNYNDVLQAKESIEAIVKNDSFNFNQFVLSNNSYQLGELQNQYEALILNIKNYQYFLNSNQTNSKIEQIKKQLNQNSVITNQLINNSSKIKASFEIDRKKYETDTLLYSKGVITKADYLASKKAWLNQETNLDANNNRISANYLTEQQFQKEIVDIRQASEKEKYEICQNIKSAAKELLLQIQNWDQKYLVRSPVSGRVNLFSFWKENQWINSGEGIMIITPSFQSVVAKGVVSIHNSGKLKIGQKVILDLVSHPSNQYGHIDGQISFISAVPMDSVYSFDIKLTNGLITNSGKKIEAKPLLFATGEIVTDNKNIADRILEGFLGTN